MVKKYIHKPIEVEAVQWTGDNLDEVKEFVHKKCDINRYKDPELTPQLIIDMLDDIIIVNGGDYIFRTAKGGGFCISKAKDFEKNYLESTLA